MNVSGETIWSIVRLGGGGLGGGADGKRWMPIPEVKRRVRRRCRRSEAIKNPPIRDRTFVCIDATV
jgi:hypothetical protein